jgi:hypothetical protein
MVNTQEADTPNEEPGGQVDEVERWRLQTETKLNQSVIKIRSEIHALLDFFAEEGLATKGTVEEYREAAEIDEDVEGLTGFMHWIVERRFMAIRCLEEIKSEIALSVEGKVISDGDRVELMDRLVVNGEVDFVGQVDQIQEAVHQELEAMAVDREEFDALLENPLVAEGTLVIGEDEKLEIPDLEGYLEMSAEKRREFLAKARLALPKAERHQELEGRKETLRLEGEFHGRLVEARKEGVIGFVAAQRFKRFFRKLDNKSKGETLEALDEILEPYVELWEEIRETFDGGRPLARLEGMRDLSDHQQLRGQFEKIVRQECARMDWEYGQALDSAYAKKMLPAKERHEWGRAMHAGDLEGKRERLESLEGDLEPYAELREGIDELEDGERIAQLDSMFVGGVFGLEEIQARLEELAEEEPEEEDDDEPDEKGLRLLSSLRRDRVKNTIVDTAEELDFTQKRRLVDRLDHYLDGKLAHECKDYDDNVKEARVEHKVAFIEHSNLLDEDDEEKLFGEEEILEEESDEIVLPLDTEICLESEAVEREEDATVIEIPEPEAEINGEETFYETVYLDREDEEDDTHVVKMLIADGEAVKSFNSNALLNAENDKLSLVTGTDDFDMEFDLKESRVLVDFLKNDLKKEETEMKAAA